MTMRQIDTPATIPGILQDADGHLPPAVNRKAAPDPVVRRIANGIKELAGKMFTDLESSANAPKRDTVPFALGDHVAVRADGRAGTITKIHPSGTIDVLMIGLGFELSFRPENLELKP